MVYAIARTTIGHFESALGRRILWSVRHTKENGAYKEEYIDRLRIYPHAFRAANAYYHPEKKSSALGLFSGIENRVRGKYARGERLHVYLPRYRRP